MRVVSLIKVALISLMLSGCVAPLLISPGSQLMWALLKPLVGFDPNEVNLFEQPLVKDRMVSILGPHYDTTVTLLKTADQLQQEGPLFYTLSRTVPGLSDKAGLVWNSDTNQMAVMLVDQQGAKVFAEPGSQPSWPDAMQGWDPTAPAAATQGAAASSASTLGAVGSALGVLSNPQKAVSGLVQGSAQSLLQGARSGAAQTATQAQKTATSRINDAVSQAVVVNPAPTATAKPAAVVAQAVEPVATNAQPTPAGAIPPLPQTDSRSDSKAASAAASTPLVSAPQAAASEPASSPETNAGSGVTPSATPSTGKPNAAMTPPSPPSTTSTQPPAPASRPAEVSQPEPSKDMPVSAATQPKAPVAQAQNTKGANAFPISKEKAAPKNTTTTEDVRAAAEAELEKLLN